MIVYVYHITNIRTGADLGAHEGRTEDEALDRMVRAAGGRSLAAALRAGSLVREDFAFALLGRSYFASRLRGSECCG
jgi:hypothetical protein